jgi:hypothetical protein
MSFIVNGVFYFVNHFLSYNYEPFMIMSQYTTYENVPDVVE